MPQCPNGHSLIEGNDYCPECGAKLRPDPPAGDSVNIRSPKSDANAQAIASLGQTVIVNPPVPESKSRFPVWVILLVIVLMAAAALVAFQLGRGNAPAASNLTPQVVDRVVRETVLIEKPFTAEVTRLATVIVEKEITRIVEKPVERRVEVPVQQTVIVEKIVTPASASLGTQATLTVPEGFRFSSPTDAQALNPVLSWQPGASPVSSYVLDPDKNELKLVAGPSSWPAFPMIMYPCQGDFSVQIKVSSNLTVAYQNAGLAVRPAGVQISSGTGLVPENWILASKYQGDRGATVLCGNSVHQTEAPYSGDPAYVRIERRGSLFSCFYSASGTNWVTLQDEKVFPLPQKIDIALFGYSTNADGVVARFSEFMLNCRQ